ncbi:MAG: Gfo/Idh/MocA family oxidoreductase [Fimbriimonadaceae bacterium]|nr:Gfo/Idh/MocA family oxidoreductase [Fimbriimonadaceae bacterium]QYK56083.1 MAG: Gfo/Idh/MocA family oxidoreductase [Fimbriimonadaceae bacterium]
MVGVVGAGNWGKNIVRTLHEMGQLAGVAEPGDALRAGLAETYPDVPVAASLTKLLETARPGAVAIATPAETHAPLAREALEAGCHVFIEKPMTLSSEDAEELVARADAAGKVLMVGHLLLYQPAVQFIKEAIDGGKIGKVHLLHHERLNLGRARNVENVLWSLGVHDVAVCLYLAGEAPSDVQFVGHKMLGTGVEDDTRLFLDFPSGQRGYVHNSWLWPELRRRLTVVGEKGMLVYDELEQKVYFHDKGVTETLQNRDEGVHLVYEGAGQPLTLEMQHFLDCIEQGTNPHSDGRSGLEVVRVLERACGKAGPAAGLPETRKAVGSKS